MCGAISFELLGELREVFNCHCHRCRQFTGHHMAATATDTADLKLDDRAEQLRWYYPVPEAGYAFCATCGSSLFWKSAQTPHRISICAGTLSPPTGLATTRAWWVTEASDYHNRQELLEFGEE
jgi:hypothetical protein